MQYNWLYREIQSTRVPELRDKSCLNKELLQHTEYICFHQYGIHGFIRRSVCAREITSQGGDVTLNIAGIHGTNDLEAENVPLQMKRFNSKVHSIETLPNLSISFANYVYHYDTLEQRFNNLSVLPNQNSRLMKIAIILGQSAYELQSPLAYKIGTRSEPFF